MPTIKGPVTFKKGELPIAVKDWISKNGLALPFSESMKTKDGLQINNREKLLVTRKK